MTKQEKQQIELTQLVMNEAADMATLIHQHISRNPKLHNIGMTVVGYAVEMIISNCSDEGGGNYDTLSENWREFVGHAHNDIKRMKANKPKGDA